MAAEIRFLALLSLAALFTAGFADTIDIDVQDDDILTRRTSNISSLVDSMLPTVREFLIKQHLDPMKMDDMTEQLPGVIMHNRHIYLNHGSLKGLTTIRRASDVLLVSDNGVLTLYATFGFNPLSCNYNYLFKSLLISRKGQLDGRLTNVEIRVVANLNLKDRKVVLQAINIVRLDDLSLTFRGHIIDPIVNAVIKRITNRFRNLVVCTIEREAKVFAQKYLNDAIAKIPFSSKYLAENDILESAPTSVNFLRI